MPGGTAVSRRFRGAGMMPRVVWCGCRGHHPNGAHGSGNPFWRSRSGPLRVITEIGDTSSRQRMEMAGCTTPRRRHPRGEGPRGGPQRPRRHLVAVSARIARPQGKRTLHLPAHWPQVTPWKALWNNTFTIETRQVAA